MDGHPGGGIAEPPQRLRLRYYLFEIRLPPAFLAWAERDIASTGWVTREVVRLMVLFGLLTLTVGRLRLNVRSAAALLCAVGAILAARNVLRRIALSYQRYGWDWTDARESGSPLARLALAVLFSVVFVLLAR